MISGLQNKKNAYVVENECGPGVDRNQVGTDKKPNVNDRGGRERERTRDPRGK